MPTDTREQLTKYLTDAHSIEEQTREKGWRASAGADMVQPLSLEMQGPDWYDGPPSRSLDAARQRT